MNFKPALVFLALFSFACNTPATSSQNKNKNNNLSVKNGPENNPYHSIINIPTPQGFSRIKVDSNSFANWLRNVPLKENKTVYLFNDDKKQNQNAQFAVLNFSVGHKDLQQCADAVMRLRAEYLFAQKRFAEIIFTDNENKIFAFKPPYNKENFTKYLDVVFSMCGSASLAKQLKVKNDFENIEPGDVLIRGGFPGHAEMVMDVAENKDGNKIFMLAQSYMPAQDIHVLKNPKNEILSPWYDVNEDDKIVTPEYLFYKTELKSW